MTDHQKLLVTGQETGSLPSRLAKLVESRTEARYPADGGFYLAEMPWNLPEQLSAAVIQDARSVLPAVRNELEPASRDVVSKWLNALGVLCAGNMTAQDASAKLNAYSAMLQVPSSVLTRANLDEAAREFKWFPSYGEISDFLESKVAQKRKILARVERIASATPSQQEPANVPWSQRTDEQKSRIDALLEQTYAKLRA